MWAVASCPKCGKQVAVPMSANAEAVMRCPLCRAMYPLQQAIDNLPPELEVVSSTQPDGESLDLPHQAPLDMPAEMTLPFAPIPFTPPEEAPRPVRKERSTTRMMLEVILGGLLAGPIALVIIMWGFGKDPLHLSDKLPQFLVPPALRADAQDRQGPTIIDVN